MKQRWKGWLVGALLAVGTLSLGTACYVQAQPEYVVDEAPPAPQYERIETRQGYVWVRGRWEWRGGRWDWKPGYYVAQRQGYAWHEGYWDRRGNRYYWVEGSWEPGVQVRDHRQPEPYIGGGGGGQPTYVVPSNPSPQQTYPQHQPYQQPQPPPPPPPSYPQGGYDAPGHHEHAHEHPHGDGAHHHHPHVHPHRPGASHHHPY